MDLVKSEYCWILTRYPLNGSLYADRLEALVARAKTVFNYQMPGFNFDQGLRATGRDHEDDEGSKDKFEFLYHAIRSGFGTLSSSIPAAIVGAVNALKEPVRPAPAKAAK